MLHDARSLPDGYELETDLCIVGAGPAGITLARELTGSGARVCLLEGGGADVDRRVQRLNHGRSVGYSYYRLADARVRAFGGTSRHWPLEEGWRARPLDAIDFEERPGIPYSGWPFDRAHLEPFYERAQSLCQLGPYSYDIADWEDPSTPRLPFSSDRVQTTLFQLGSTTFEGYYDDLVRATNTHLFLHAHVVDVATDRQPEVVDRVSVRHADGRTFSVRAGVFVLAGGGIENPRLLLVSDRTHARGLGNGHGLVGRFFAERLSTRSGFVVTDRPRLLRETELYNSRYVRDARIQATIGIDERVMREQQLLNCTFFLQQRPAPFTAEGVRSIATLMKGLRRRPFPDKPLRHLRNIATSADDLARLAAQRVVGSSDGEEGVLVMRPQAEQAPNPDSRITLSHRRDELGLPRVELDWRPTEFDRRSIRRSQQIVDEELRRAGLGRLELLLGDEDPPALFEGNRHHMGTTRMHADPKLGVVNGDGRVHGLSNLYLTGSSIFPTVGCSNPTLTIVALALRLGAHLRRVLDRTQTPRLSG